MDPKSFKCPNCEYVDELDGLRRHCVRKHDINAEQMYVSVVLNNQLPKCACGCNATITKFWGIERGFSRFIRGHHSRINNNWGHNKEAQKKSQDVRREMHKRGEIPIWNKGQTKESDARIAELGQTQSKNFTPERRAKRATIMKQSWETGAIVPLSGPAHSQWKGGTSLLQQICRSRVFNAWSRPKLEAAKYTCQKCFASNCAIVVHHDQERFAAILHKAIEKFGDVDPTRPDDDFEKKSQIADWVTDYHVQNDVSGLVLCEGCHAQEHAA